MMIRFLFAAVVFLGLFANAQTSVSFRNECSARIQGGVDVFPWSVARPFPWNNIQGVWMLKDGLKPIYIKAKVVRTTSNRKILKLSVINGASCAKPLAEGVGYIDTSEKNVVRAIINDGVSKYQMKLALFDIKDLHINTYGCEESILAASLQMIGDTQSSLVSFGGLTNYELTPENLMLKKISSDLGSVCKKIGSR